MFFRKRIDNCRTITIKNSSFIYENASELWWRIDRQLYISYWNISIVQVYEQSNMKLFLYHMAVFFFNKWGFCFVSEIKAPFLWKERVPIWSRERFCLLLSQIVLHNYDRVHCSITWVNSALSTFIFTTVQCRKRCYFGSPGIIEMC